MCTMSSRFTMFTCFPRTLINPSLTCEPLVIIAKLDKPSIHMWNCEKSFNLGQLTSLKRVTRVSLLFLHIEQQIIMDQMQWKSNETLHIACYCWLNCGALHMQKKIPESVIVELELELGGRMCLDASISGRPFPSNHTFVQWLLWLSKLTFCQNLVLKYYMYKNSVF